MNSPLYTEAAGGPDVICHPWKVRPEQQFIFLGNFTMSVNICQRSYWNVRHLLFTLRGKVSQKVKLLLWASSPAVMCHPWKVWPKQKFNFLGHFTMSLNINICQRSYWNVHHLKFTLRGSVSQKIQLDYHFIYWNITWYLIFWPIFDKSMNNWSSPPVVTVGIQYAVRKWKTKFSQYVIC